MAAVTGVDPSIAAAAVSRAPPALGPPAAVPVRRVWPPSSSLAGDAFLRAPQPPPRPPPPSRRGEGVKGQKPRAARGGAQSGLRAGESDLLGGGGWGGAEGVLLSATT